MMQRRYGALRFVAFALQVLAWVSLILGLLVALGIFLAGVSNVIELPLASQMSGGSAVTMSLVAGVVGGIAALLAAVVNFVVFLAASQFVNLLIDAEQNTRITAELLHRLWAAQTASFSAPAMPATDLMNSDPAIAFNDLNPGDLEPAEGAEPTITTAAQANTTSSTTPMP